jgi:hypothetical protein
LILVLLSGFYETRGLLLNFQQKTLKKKYLKLLSIPETLASAFLLQNGSGERIDFYSYFLLPTFVLDKRFSTAIA